jgi:hypothetical protein
MNEVEFGTIISPMKQQSSVGLSLPPHQRPFLTHGTYQFSIGGQEVVFGEWFPPEINDVISGAVWATTRMFAEVQRRQRNWDVALVSMRDNILELTREISELKSEVQRLQQSRAYVVPLTTLTPSFRMLQQIPVTIEGDGEDFTATFIEANVSASGETEADAIANFKNSLLSSYELLESLPASQLGPLPARQWGILRDVVKRTD